MSIYKEVAMKNLTYLALLLLLITLSACGGGDSKPKPPKQESKSQWGDMFWGKSTWQSSNQSETIK